MFRTTFFTFLFTIAFCGTYQNSIDVVSDRFYPSKAEEKQSCSCKDTPSISELIDCEPIVFRNGAKLYREFDCESSQLVFENRKGVKKILYSLEGDLIDLTYRLGYQFDEEFDDVLLFQNRQASGGGFPINYELLSKENGEVVKDFGPVIYYEDTSIDPFVLFFASDSMNAITVYLLKSKAERTVSIPTDRIARTTASSNEAHGQFLFEKPVINGHVLTLNYKYLEKGSADRWNTDLIVIDLKAIRSR